ncbi:MAG: hypothetical protein FWF86_05210 [Clostridia bacterium]|nr:hypothetical protein [Clostridia bacterium]
MKKTQKITLIIVLAIVLLVGVLFLVASASMNNAKKLQAYSFDGDQIPSFNSVVGERKVTGVGSASSTGGIRKKDYTYETQSRDADVNAYTAALQEAGFIIAGTKDGGAFKGGIQFGIASADEGKIITLDLSWDNNKVTVELAKMEGTVTRY